MSSSAPPTNPSRPRLLDTEKAAEILGLKPSTLDGWRCRGGGPPYLKLGAAVRYVESELLEWALSRRATG